MAKKGYHSLYKKSKSSSGVKAAAKKKSKPQAARAESTFKRQPKAQKQAPLTKDEKRRMKIWASTGYDKKIKEKRGKEKEKRTKASGGTRQSQKRKQGGY